MKATLKIYRGKNLINSYEWTDDDHVLRHFARCFTNKLKGIHTRVHRSPYGETITITHTWPNDPLERDCRYCYVFEGVEKEA